MSSGLPSLSHSSGMLQVSRTLDPHRIQATACLPKHSCMLHRIIDKKGEPLKKPALAMKMAGTVTDASAIRNQFDKAVKALPPQNNPQSVTGVDAQGGFVIGNPLAAVVQGGQLKSAALSSLTATK